jgi:calcineurin-like phosphoesterase family protein
MTTFYTADLHFGHTNIIDYCHRPFDDAAQMDEAIVSLWNDQVAWSDEVIVVGDLCMGKLADSLAMVELLNGSILLIPGNHDRCHPMHKKADASRRRYEADGVLQVSDTTEIVHLDGYSVLVNHFPYEGDSQDVDRFAEWRVDDHGGWLLHGHVHDLWLQKGRQINVGIDAWGGRLAPQDEVLALIQSKAKDLPARRWT